jgi:hypothetical protein
VKSKAILIGTMTILAIFVGTSAFSNSSAYAASISVVCAAPPGQNPAPSNGTSLVYAIINDNLIDFTEVVADDVFGHSIGWDPNGAATFFLVDVPSVATSNSVIAVSTNDVPNINVCGVNLVIPEGLEANITKSMNTTASK